MNDNDMRDRLVLPVLIPVGALAFVGFFALSVSQVLLHLPHQVATAVALMLAFNMLIVFAVIAMRPDIGRTLTLGMGCIALLPLVLGAAAAAGIVTLPAEKEAGPSLPVVALAAKNISFNTAALKIPAGKAFEIHFNNQEGQPHNVDIHPDGGASLFKGDIVTGPKAVVYKVKPIPAGTYHFQCDVHPTMAGTVTAA